MEKAYLGRLNGELSPTRRREFIWAPKRFPGLGGAVDVARSSPAGRLLDQADMVSDRRRSDVGNARRHPFLWIASGCRWWIPFHLTSRINISQVRKREGGEKDEREGPLWRTA